MLLVLLKNRSLSPLPNIGQLFNTKRSCSMTVEDNRDKDIIVSIFIYTLISSGHIVTIIQIKVKRLRTSNLTYLQRHLR